MVMTPTSILAYALRYAERGLSVVPVHSAASGKCSCGNGRCESPGKHPRQRWRGQSQAALTVDELAQLWRKYPDSNIGIVTGEISGIVVIDIDGVKGLESLKSIGLDLDKLETPAVESGGGGWHIYCRYPADADYSLITRAGVLPSVDIRADGGVIIAPPSLHSSGKRYEWVDGLSLDDLDPVEIDLSWAVPTHTNGRVHTNGKVHDDEEEEEPWFEDLLASGVSEGTRNESATKLAGRWLGMGLTTGEVLLILQAWNQANDPPLPRRDLEVIVDSITRRENEHLDRTDQIGKINKALKLLELRDVVRITGDEPQLILKFKEGDMQITTEHLLSPRQFVISVAKATKVVLKEFGPHRYPRQAELGKWIIEASRDEDAGAEATSLGDTHSLVLDYLDAQRIITVESLQEVPKHGCFRTTNGPIWISLGEFVDWANTRAGSKMSRPQTAQKLKALGWRKHEFQTDEHGRRPAWAKG